MKIKDKMLLVLLTILFFPISIPLLIVDYFSERKKRLRVLKRNGFSHKLLKSISHFYSEYIYYKDNICIKIYGDYEVEISFNFLDKEPVFDKIYKLNIGTEIERKQLLTANLTYLDTPDMEKRKGKVKPYVDIAIDFITTHINELLTLKPPYFISDVSSLKKEIKDYIDNRNMQRKMVFEQVISNMKTNLVTGLTHVTLKYQRLDSCYMDLRPGRYVVSMNDNKEQLFNAISFREDEFEVIENILLKVNTNYNNMGHFGVTNYDEIMIKEIINQLTRFIEMYKDNDIYTSFKLMDFNALEQESIEKHFDENYVSPFEDKERMIMVYQETIIWLSRVLDSYGCMTVCGI